MTKHSVVLLALAALSLLLGGCEIIIDDGDWPDDQQIENPHDSTVITEIDAAGTLAFESDKHAAYMRIAERPGLSDTVVVHLVEAIFEKLSFESSQLDILLNIIGGPNFSPAAKEEILGSLSKLEFESSKSKVLDAISDRSF
jgi:hypothetical protein